MESPRGHGGCGSLTASMDPPRGHYEAASLESPRGHGGGGSLTASVDLPRGHGGGGGNLTTPLEPPRCRGGFTPAAMPQTFVEPQDQDHVQYPVPAVRRTSSPAGAKTATATMAGISLAPPGPWPPAIPTWRPACENGGKVAPPVSAGAAPSEPVAGAAANGPAAASGIGGIQDRIARLEQRLHGAINGDQQHDGSTFSSGSLPAAGATAASIPESPVSFSDKQ